MCRFFTTFSIVGKYIINPQRKEKTQENKNGVQGSASVNRERIEKNNILLRSAGANWKFLYKISPANETILSARTGYPIVRSLSTRTLSSTA